MKTLRIFSILCLGILVSCGFHLGQGSLPDRYNSLTVPYIKGDKDGRFTSALVGALSRSGAWKYHRDSGELIVDVDIQRIREDRIGYRYDRERDGTVNERLVPAEGRLTASAKLVVRERASRKVVLGPVIVTAAVDFDHDFYTTKERVPTFSLGQLDDIHVAREAATGPLGEELARVITEYLTNAW